MPIHAGAKVASPEPLLDGRLKLRHLVLAAFLEDLSAVAEQLREREPVS